MFLRTVWLNQCFIGKQWFLLSLNSWSTVSSNCLFLHSPSIPLQLLPFLRHIQSVSLSYMSAKVIKRYRRCRLNLLVKQIRSLFDPSTIPSRQRLQLDPSVLADSWNKVEQRRDLSSLRESKIQWLADRTKIKRSEKRRRKSSVTYITTIQVTLLFFKQRTKLAESQEVSSPHREIWPQNFTHGIQLSQRDPKRHSWQ